MSKQDDFYIGWKENLSKSGRKFLRRRLVLIFIALPILVFLLVYFQKPFNDHRFELGSVINVTGTYYHKPFPLIRVEPGSLPDLAQTDVLLVGYGKFGATGTMDLIQNTQGDLHGKRITLAGTLIYGNGKTLMELTRDDESLVEIKDELIQNVGLDFQNSQIQLTGEILDPKCYFGVMKPGEGKIHKSCAIRCISGGIPPVFRHETGMTDNPYDYYLLLDASGSPMHKSVLPYVAEKLSITGKTGTFLSWKILYADIDQFKIIH